MHLSKIYPLLLINVSYETFTLLASRQTGCFIAAGTNLIHDRRFHPYILLLCIYLSFAQLACNIAKRHRTAARALMCIFRGKAVWCLAPFCILCVMHRHKNACLRPTPEDYLCMILSVILSALLILQYALSRFYLLIMHRLCISVGRNAAASLLKKLFSPLFILCAFVKRKNKKAQICMRSSIWFFWKFCAR